MVPSGYSVSIDQATITSANDTAMSFTFASAEVGADYTYSIDDTNGATSAITGSGTIATATDQITGIDVSGLDDDTLTLTVYLTDSYGNQGGNTTDTVGKTTIPSSYIISVNGQSSWPENGTYTRSGELNTKPKYQSANQYTIVWSGSCWELRDDFGDMIWYNNSTSDTPPESGWVDGFGGGDTLTVTAN